MNVSEAIDRVVAVRLAAGDIVLTEDQDRSLWDTRGIRAIRQEVEQFPAVHGSDGNACSPACTGCLATIHYNIARDLAQEPAIGPGADARWYQDYADALFLLHEEQRRENAGRDAAEPEAER
jgi:hypothetical protein